MVASCRVRQEPLLYLAEKQDALGIPNAAIRLHHPNVVDPSHRHPVRSTVCPTKTVIIPEYARKFAVVEHEAMRSSKNDLGLWLGHVRNVMFGAAAPAAIDSVIRSLEAELTSSIRWRQAQFSQFGPDMAHVGAA